MLQFLGEVRHSAIARRFLLSYPATRRSSPFQPLLGKRTRKGKEPGRILSVHVRARMARTFLRYFVVPGLQRVRHIPVLAFPKDWSQVSARLDHLLASLERVSRKAAERLRKHLTMISVVGTSPSSLRYATRIRTLYIGLETLAHQPEKRLVRELVAAATLAYLEAHTHGDAPSRRSLEIAEAAAARAVDGLQWWQ